MQGARADNQIERFRTPRAFLDINAFESHAVCNSCLLGVLSGNRQARVRQVDSHNADIPASQRQHHRQLPRSCTNVQDASRGRQLLD
jgi:hypothetical protein